MASAEAPGPFPVAFLEGRESREFMGVGGGKWLFVWGDVRQFGVRVFLKELALAVLVVSLVVVVDVVDSG